MMKLIRLQYMYIQKLFGQYWKYSEHDFFFCVWGGEASLKILWTGLGWKSAKYKQCLKNAYMLLDKGHIWKESKDTHKHICGEVFQKPTFHYA